jgi:transcriptional regulator with XRE-family HTH domain
VTFGEYLKKCREEAGLSTTKLAKLLGVSLQYLWDLERGQRGFLSPARWEALCRVTPADPLLITRLWWEHQLAQVNLPPAGRKKLEADLAQVLKELSS